jgi:predicted nucleic acid-binding protein
MRQVFADTFYWVALVNPGDAFHARVTTVSRTLGSARLVTTDEVLIEMLNWFCRWGPQWRNEAATLVHDVRSDPNVDVLPQTRADFDAALALYKARPDKAYSVTDLPLDGRTAGAGHFRGIDQRSSFHPRRVHHLVPLVPAPRPGAGAVPGRRGLLGDKDPRRPLLDVIAARTKRWP